MKTALPTLREVVDTQNDFVEDSQDIEIIFKYNDFLKQPLKLEMFIPCNDNGEPLEKPVKENYRDIVTNKFDEYGYAVDLEEYKYAKERVLFKGFYLSNNGKYNTAIKNNRITLIYSKVTNVWNVETISDLTNKVELTPNGIKQSGL